MLTHRMLSFCFGIRSHPARGITFWNGVFAVLVRVMFIYGLFGRFAVMGNLMVCAELGMARCG